MIWPWRRGWRWSPMLLMMCTGLIGIIYIEATLVLPKDKPAVAAVVSDITSKTVDTEPSFTMPPLNNYSEVLTRPLFSPTRTPTPTTVDGNATNATDFVIVGIVMSGQTRHALIRNRLSSKLERVVEGQDIDGWVVDSILNDRIAFLHSGTRFELKADDKAGRTIR